MARRSIPLAKVRAECHRITKELVASGGATRESLAAFEPGGIENPDPEGYLRWYGLLNQAWARHQVQADSVREPDQQEVADRIATAALADIPEVIELTRPLSDGRRVLSVYPKSAVALSAIRHRDELLGRVAESRATLALSPSPKHARMVELCDREMATQLALLVWAVTHEGPRLPYDPADAPAPPDWTADLSPWDVLLVMRAHQRVNGQRLQALSLLTTAPDPGERGTAARWSTFFGEAAVRLGVSATTLLHDRSLAEVVTSFRLSAEAHKQAHAEAERRAKRAA